MTGFIQSYISIVKNVSCPAASPLPILDNLVNGIRSNEPAYMLICVFSFAPILNTQDFAMAAVLWQALVNLALLDIGVWNCHQGYIGADLEYHCQYPRLHGHCEWSVTKRSVVRVHQIPMATYGYHLMIGVGYFCNIFFYLHSPGIFCCHGTQWSQI